MRRHRTLTRADRGARRLVRLARAGLALAVVGVALAGCSPHGGDETAGLGTDARVPADSLHGAVLPDSLERPERPLRDTSGEPYVIAEETEGKLALVFFGYTHCPDVCPVHMAALAGALDHLGSEAKRATEVVFVSTDPDRDTPDRIREWLDRWDRDFVGLRGTETEVAEIQRSLNLPPSVKEPAGPDGDYMVGHSAQVVAFTPDGRTIHYPFGTRQSDWVHDLPLLLELEEDGARAAGSTAAARSPAR
ncbi:MAG: SCO family protein [Gemmatimonadota bacterium]|nr:SCO family protein [Gemmatimonadota bacterium]